ncbi:MopE-related protein [Neolewinella antarctica]|uniref:Secretion system C-terminal sorting domain-containing protein n=1 Tax=Neolewinella antarctica TaxID=442734 RepID=A0ABX0XC37_9BACT|nr:MopE-related protein [Neolewinella antarctica]NJC26645.1 hypothetical protein [Neolewinella antarctica]
MNYYKLTWVAKLSWVLVCLLSAFVLSATDTNSFTTSDPTESSVPGSGNSDATLMAASVRVENMTKVPGTNRGFPADDFLTFHRTKKLTNTKGEVVQVNDRNVIRIHNDGNSSLNITKLTTTNTTNFKISGVNIPSGGLKVAAGKFVDAMVIFITDDAPARSVITEQLVLKSDAQNNASVKVTLRGAFMLRVESRNEINAQQIMDSYGFKTEMGRDKGGKLITRPGSKIPSDKKVNDGDEGDLILSGYYTAADPAKPVQIFQLAAFHSPGRAGITARLRRNVPTAIGFSHNKLSHQTLLPRLRDDLTKIASGRGIISDSFYVTMANYYTKGGGLQGKGDKKLLAVRTYRVFDHNGDVVPNEYILLQDYIGKGCGVGSNNCDWNDNVAYMINARPTGVPTSRSIDDLQVATERQQRYDVSKSFSRGFPGNRLNYTATLDGGPLPGWITINAQTGRFTIIAPEATGGKKFDIVVTAKDDNSLTTKSSFVMTARGSGTDAPSGVWLEAECAQVGSKWTTVNSDDASSRQYVVYQGPDALNGPPNDVAANRVRFTVDIESAGDYFLFSRVLASTTDGDSFWVRANGGGWRNWKSGIILDTDFRWNQTTGSTFPLSKGINTIDFAFREAGTQLDKIHLDEDKKVPKNFGEPAVGETFYVDADGDGFGDPTDAVVACTRPDGHVTNADDCDDSDDTVYPGAPELCDGVDNNCNGKVDDGIECRGDDVESQFWLEAECAQVGSKWTTASSDDASGKQYVVFLGGNAEKSPPTDVPANRVRFNLDNDTAGDYFLFARVLAPTTDDDSFWVRTNGEGWRKWKNGLIRGSDFRWNQATNKTFSLTEGVNTIDFAFREDGAQLDKIHLNLSGDLPQGLGEEVVGDTYYADTDGDGFGDVNNATVACTQPTGFVTNAFDCDDTNELVNPGAEERCDGIDNNCNDLVDEGAQCDDTDPRTEFWLEAECTAVGSAWKTVNSPAASGGQAFVYDGSAESLTSPPADIAANRIRFVINIAESGSFDLYVRMLTATTSDDSFWVRVNGQGWLKWKSGFQYGDDYYWNELTRGPFGLDEGSNTIDIAHRENGAIIDKIYLTKGGAEPVGLGETDQSCTDSEVFSQAPGEDGSVIDQGLHLESTNQEPLRSESTIRTANDDDLNSGTSTTGGSPVSRSLRNEATLKVYPNPTVDRLNFSLRGDHRGQVTVQIINMQGAELRRLSFNQESSLLTGEVPTADFAPGTYVMRIIAEGHSVQQSLFVKVSR